MVAGRSNEGRTASVTTTNAAAGITAAAGTFHEEDAGRAISGAGIPAAATIASVTSDTAATLSANATASATVTATLAASSGASYGFTGWSPETDPESETYSVAAVNAAAVTPDRLANPYTAVSQRSRG